MHNPYYDQWNAYFLNWCEGVSNKFGLPTPLFLDLPVYLPHKFSSHETPLGWWPIEDIDKNLTEIQGRFLNVGSYYLWPVGDGSMTKGEYATLQYLFHFQDDLQLLCATLALATLFPYHYSSRSYSYPSKWVQPEKVIDIIMMLHSRFKEGRPLWHPAMIDVLPSLPWDLRDKEIDRVEIRSLSEMAFYFGSYHSHLLSLFRPVAIRFYETGDPELVARLQEKKRQSQKEWEEWEKRQKEREQKESEYEQAMKKIHPRWGEWGSVTKAELKKLVWSKPTTAIASEFGISNAAVGKKCKALGISKPPRGYWAKVHSQRGNT